MKISPTFTYKRRFNQHAVLIMEPFLCVARSLSLFFFQTDVCGPKMFDPSGARTVSDGYAQHPAEQLPCRRGRRDFSCHSTTAAFRRCRTVRGPVRINRRQRRAAGCRWTLADLHNPLTPPAKAKRMKQQGNQTGASPHM